MIWKPDHRPGYFGKRRDQRIAELNAKFGYDNWKLAHVVKGMMNSPTYNHVGEERAYDFVDACRNFYELSYYLYFKDRPDDLAYACQFSECYDNDPENVKSGLDYSIQTAASTHIQDIALRNVMQRLGLKFTGARAELMQIRAKNTLGSRFSPYNVPFAWPELITQPSLAPEWAPAGSVEDFWQSNKWVLVKEG